MPYTERRRPLTRRQAEVLALLAEIPQPTYREMARRLAIVSSGAMHFFLHALEAKGWVRRTPAIPGRGMRGGGARGRAVDVLYDEPLPRVLVTQSGVELRRVPIVEVRG